MKYLFTLLLLSSLGLLLGACGPYSSASKECLTLYEGESIVVPDSFALRKANGEQWPDPKDNLQSNRRFRWSQVQLAQESLPPSHYTTYNPIQWLSFQNESYFVLRTKLLEQPVELVARLGTHWSPDHPIDQVEIIAINTFYQEHTLLPPLPTINPNKIISLNKGTLKNITLNKDKDIYWLSGELDVNVEEKDAPNRTLEERTPQNSPQTHHFTGVFRGEIHPICSTSIISSHEPIHSELKKIADDHFDHLRKKWRNVTNATKEALPAHCATDHTLRDLFQTAQKTTLLDVKDLPCNDVIDVTNGSEPVMTAPPNGN